MSESKKKQSSAYPLRMADDVKDWLKKRAASNDRTVHSELNRILKGVKEAEEQEQPKP